MNSKRFHWDTRPVALKENIVQGKTYRFTILTSCLIRMEYSKTEAFEDRPSQSVFYRDFPKTEYQVSKADELLIIETKDLRLEYKMEEDFSEDSLKIQLKKEPASCWRYGEDFEDLGGTSKTLDQADGEIPLERGVCSRNGFSVIDDSDTLLLGEDDWVEVRRPGMRDVYFFGYGFDYIGAVRDFYRLTGVPPMLPDYALGNWWSRYYPYTQEQYIGLMEKFKEEGIPFSVSVVDMDWHLVRIPKEYHDENDKLEGNGWTGYTWNKELFPDYREFLRYLNENNLKTALNLHPHAGVRQFDDMYEEMAKACGVDPSGKKRVPFDILSRNYMEQYFDILHHPYEEDGVNFWWMDWQQGNDYGWIHEPNKDGKLHDEREVLDPLWMLNHLHILDISRNGKRPMFFSRYCGPGSHRYPVGFSGDTIVTWESLKFQPYFTATASNVGYCWWSHDIGGHMYGYRDDELNVRWIQLGVFSPINRLHSSCSEFIRKEPWAYDVSTSEILKKWLRLRHRLFPYLYTMNYRTHTQLLPLVQPMYYQYPKCSGAYEVPEQFFFGSELIVAPIVEKNSPVSMLGKANVWLPRGEWFDLFDGTHYASKKGRKLQLHRSLERIPVLAKAGAIIPMAIYDKHSNRLGNSKDMEVVVFPDGDNQFELYEDEGDLHNYEKGVCAITKMCMEWGDTPCFSICPAEGAISFLPQVRTWKICLRGFATGLRVKVEIGEEESGVQGTISTPNFGQNQDTESASGDYVVTVTAPITEKISVHIAGDVLVNDNGNVPDKCMEILRNSQMEFETKKRIWEAITEEGTTLHEKLFRITGASPDYRPVIEAIKEQLCLTEDEYRGRQL